MAKSFYITTPIYYPNDIPHIGTAYTTIAADVLARYHRQCGESVWFLTGSDEHGQKVESSAKAHNKTPQVYVDEVVTGFKKVWECLNISYDDFIRTTEERHTKAVQEIFKSLLSKDDIYKGHYEGWYCVSCETFWLESQVVEGKCSNIECRRPVQWVREEGYFFRLSKYAGRLLEHIEAHPNFILPVSRRNEVISFIKQELHDLCVTRKNLSWGISVPDDPEYSMYVWLDALNNYITALGYPQNTEKFRTFWPAQVHLMAKDIIRFHGIIWPALLMAMGIDLPEIIFAHGWLVIGGEKISKSKGVNKNILELLEVYGADALRYFLMREASLGLDFEFSEESLTRRYNAELANDLGNLLNRALSMLEKYRNGVIPAVSGLEPHDEEMLKAIAVWQKEYAQNMDKLELRQALAALWSIVERLNKYVEESAPWKLAKEADGSRLDTVLANLYEGLRILAIMVFPVIPASARKIWAQLGRGEDLSQQTLQDAQWKSLNTGIKVQKPSPIFPRIET
jgi:methionyl-tRNA synthetase